MPLWGLSQLQKTGSVYKAAPIIGHERYRHTIATLPLRLPSEDSYVKQCLHLYMVELNSPRPTECLSAIA